MDKIRHFGRGRLPALALAVLLAPLFLTACGSMHFDSLHDLDPGSGLSIRVQGQRPYVAVSNDGPGVVSVAWTEGAEALETIVRGTHGRTLIAPARVTVYASAEDHSRIRIAVQKAAGLETEVIPRLACKDDLHPEGR
ncbi:MAG: hypothetical protein KDC98_25710 [Planctomycetes bacterium]|nr:hypothetical protein [Planctomycetota bacterium]